MLSKIRLISYKILLEILVDKNKSKIVIDTYLTDTVEHKNQINNLVFGVLRYYFIFKNFLKLKTKKEPLIKASVVFYMAFYEFFFNNSSKLYAIKSEYLSLLDKYKLSKYKPLLYAILVKLNKEEFNFFFKDINKFYPVFFINELKNINNLDLSIYINNLLTKPSFGVFISNNKLLEEIKNKYELNSFLNFYYTKNSSILKSTYLENKSIYIQDLASQIPASLIDYNSNIKVLDLCSAPGGKAINIASNLLKHNNKNKLVAVEKNRTKYISLLDNIKHFNNIDALNEDLFDLKFNYFFDYVLLDPPCSSLGTVKRHPEVLINKNSIDINLADLQYKILVKAASFVKVHGFLIYSVCTFTNIETYGLIDRFLSNFSFSIVRIDNKNIFKDNFYINTAYFNDIMDTHFIVKLKKNKD